MSIVHSLLEIIGQELEKHEASKLLLVRVKHGRLANVVPEAMDMAWEVMTKDTPYDGAVLEMEEVPFRVRCGGCGQEFEPDADMILLMPCPECGEELGHVVISGKELYLDHLEAE